MCEQALPRYDPTRIATQPTSFPETFDLLFIRSATPPFSHNRLPTELPQIKPSISTGAVFPGRLRVSRSEQPPSCSSKRLRRVTPSGRGPRGLAILHRNSARGRSPILNQSKVGTPRPRIRRRDLFLHLVLQANWWGLRRRRSWAAEETENQELAAPACRASEFTEIESDNV